MMKVYYDKDADQSLLKGKKVAVIGYGSQGFAHSNNLKESGVDVMVGLRKGSKSWDKAAGAGLKVVEVAEAAKVADIIMILVPDELQGGMYRKDIEQNIKKGAYLAFAHGFNAEDVGLLAKRLQNPLTVAESREIADAAVQLQLHERGQLVHPPGAVALVKTGRVLEQIDDLHSLIIKDLRGQIADFPAYLGTAGNHILAEDAGGA